jgi:hypothetical protein
MQDVRLGFIITVIYSRLKRIVVRNGQTFGNVQGLA